jgi:hypothetical protein
MQWILNCYSGRIVLGAHLASLRNDAFSLCESVFTLSADPIATTYPPMAEAVVRATELQGQQGLLITQLEEHASTFLTPRHVPELEAPSQQDPAHGFGV